MHRIGRTGRKDKKGTAYTFFTKANFKQAHELINVLREANQVISPKLVESARYGGSGGNDFRYRRYGTMPRNSYGSKPSFGGAKTNESTKFGGGAASKNDFEKRNGFGLKRKSRFDDYSGPTNPPKLANYGVYSNGREY